MRHLVFIILIFCFYSCKENKQGVGQQEIIIKPNEFKTYLLQENSNNSFTVKHTNFNIIGKQKVEENQILESYYKIHSKKNTTSSLFESMKLWCNDKLKTTETNNKLNQWTTDEKVYFLYKQDDSTIFVNIYLKDNKY